MAEATLLVIQGIDQGARFELGDEPLGIGRGIGNEIRLLDTEVSRQHATLHCSDDAFFIRDRNSSNGTFVNGEAVRTRQLSGGDQIQIGRTVMLFSTDAEQIEHDSAANMIHLVGRQEADDRSSIVDEVAPDAGRTYITESPVDVPSTIAQTLANLQALYRVSEESVRPATSADQLLKRILDLTIDAVGADRGCILVSEDGSRDVAPRVFTNRRGRDQSDRMPVSRSIVSYVLERGQGVRTSDARSDERFEPGQSIFQAGIREAMCVPIHGHAELMGVMYVDITTPPERVLSEQNHTHKFSEDQLRLLAAIGRQAALAIENSRYQDALLKAERLATMGQTIALLSHHIKNILQGVRGGSYLIDMGLNDHSEEMIRKGWGIVEKNQNKIYHLVMDMLTFSKERQPSLERTSLNDTVSEVCELMQARADECGVAFESRLDSAIEETTLDPEGIHRAVLNIVTNAIDAVEGTESGAVTVETAFEGETDRVAVRVTDNGPGIPPDQLNKIFNIFESTKGARGTGLGLAVSQKIIREHGGEIVVESTPGEGCRFTLSWPRIDEEHGSGEGRTMVE